AQRPYSTATSPQSLLPAMGQHSAYGHIDQTLSNNVTLFAQAIYNYTHSTSIATSPGTTYTDYLDTNGYTIGGSGGATVTLGSWEVVPTITYGKDHFDHVDNNPSFAYFSHELPTNEVTIAEVNSDGPLFSLPAGQVLAALGGGYRSERFSD